MATAGEIDQIVIVNGPQDGTEFPIIRAPFDLGRDRSCTVHIDLDSSVQPLHARVSAVPKGYRIRNCGAGSVFVDAKRVRSYRSRVVRSRGLVQVGHTLLMVRCAPDGLAARSHHVIGQSDLIWLGQHALHEVFLALRSVCLWLYRLICRVLSSWMGVCAVLVLLYIFWPAGRTFVNDFVSRFYLGLLQRFLSAVGA
jgi:hypothetical protein